MAEFAEYLYSFDISGQMGGYYNPYASGFSAAHMAAAAAAAAAQQTGQVRFRQDFCIFIVHLVTLFQEPCLPSYKQSHIGAALLAEISNNKKTAFGPSSISE